MVQGPRVKIVQRRHAAHHAGQRLGDGHVRRVGDMPHAIHHVETNLGVEGTLHLPRRSAELDAAASLGDFIHAEAVPLEPPGDDVQVLLVHPEPLAELLRAEPAMVVRRLWILLLR